MVADNASRGRETNQPITLRTIEAVSVVVAMRNEASSIVTLISDLKRQRLLPSEVILVDGGSTDATLAIANAAIGDDPRFHIIELEEATPGKGRNVGILEAKSEWIALTDAGVSLSESWLHALVDSAEQDDSHQVIYGSIEMRSDSIKQLVIANIVDPGNHTYTCQHEDIIHGPVKSMLLAKKVWESVGGFPDFRAGEDLIFTERIFKAGFKAGKSKDAIVIWTPPANFGQLFSRTREFSRVNARAGLQRGWRMRVFWRYIIATTITIFALAKFRPALIFVPVAMILRSRRRISPVLVKGEFSIFDKLSLLGNAFISLLVCDFATFVGWMDSFGNVE